MPRRAAGLFFSAMCVWGILKKAFAGAGNPKVRRGETPAEAHFSIWRHTDFFFRSGMKSRSQAAKTRSGSWKHFRGADIFHFRLTVLKNHTEKTDSLFGKANAAFRNGVSAIAQNPLPKRMRKNLPRLKCSPMSFRGETDRESRKAVLVRKLSCMI